jgi:hypothetical protein
MTAGGGVNKGVIAKMKYIELEGQKVRPVSTFWVVYDPKGQPRDFFPSSTNIMDNLPRAARTYWLNTDEVILKLHEGWRLNLVTSETFKRIAPRVVPLED